MDPTAQKKHIDEFVEQQTNGWIAYRRERHSNPEPSGAEVATSHSIHTRLAALGIDAKICERGVGVVGDLCVGNANDATAAIAIRADIDALRMPDRKPVTYASIHQDLAHACGHDVHTTVVLGVAETLCHLTTTTDLLSDARFRFIFQAAEETGDGAKWMLDDGYLNGVQSILGLHVEPNLLVGEIGVRYGVLTAAVDEVHIKVKGQGGHTARPHSTTDPIQCGTMLVSHLYQTLPRNADVREASVFSVGRFHGGHATNVIPDEVAISGTLRTTSPDSRIKLLKTIRQTAQHFAELTGNEIEVSLGHTLGSVINTAKETQAIEQAAADVLGADKVHILDRPSMGGEDFGVYTEHLNGSQFRLGCATSLPWPHLHSPVFDVDEKAIAIAVRTICRAAIGLSGHQQS